MIGSNGFRLKARLKVFIEGGIGIFGFAVSSIFWIGFCTKTLRFFGFGACCGLQFPFYFALNFRFSAKIKSGFRIAIRCFSGFSLENMRFNDLNRVLVFSDFASGFSYE